MKILNVWVAIFFSVLTFTACNEDDEQPIKADAIEEGMGRANIYITDAPVDDENISGVYISINGVEANGADGWTVVEQFDEPKVIDLLSYQDGESFFLTDEAIPTGKYTGLRLMMDVNEVSDASGASSAYVQYKDGTKKALYAPSGEQSGYKTTGMFNVSGDTEVSLTIDFDVRKAIVNANDGEKMILKPALRMVDNNISGTIEGKLTGSEDFAKIAVYAYSNDKFAESEMDKRDMTSTRFANAVSSNVINKDEEFTLAFLQAGTYDLYFAMLDDNGEFLNMLGSRQNVTVNAQGKMNLDVQLDELK